MMEDALSLENEVTRADELEGILRKCVSSARQRVGNSPKLVKSSSNVQTSDLKADTNTNKRVTELIGALSCLQKSHNSLQKESDELRQEVVQLRKELAHRGRPAETTIDDTSHARLPQKITSATIDSAMLRDGHTQAMLLVLPYLPALERCRVATVCSKWRKLSFHQSLWKHLSLREASVAPKDLKQLALRCHSTESISFYELIPRPASCEENLESYIDSQRAALEPSLGVLLQSCCQSLSSLSIVNCSLQFTDRTLWLASALCPNLQQFQYTSEEFPPSYEAIWSLSNGCPSIRSLSFPPILHSEMVEHFNDSCLLQIARGFPCLTWLSIGGPAITAEGLQTLLSSTRSLQHFELCGGPQLNKAVVKQLLHSGIPALQSIVISHTQISPQAIILLVENCSTLKQLLLTVTFTDYFNTSDFNSEQRYRRILTNLTILSNHPDIGKVFYLHCIT